MIFKQDTEKNELNLIFTETDEVGTVKLVEDFCDGMAWFFIMFAARVGCQSENAKVLKKVCMEQIEKTVDAVIDDGNLEKLQKVLESRVPIKQYLQKFPKWGRFGVTSVTPFLLLPVHPEGCTPARRT